MLVQNFFPSIGGAERQALELSRVLLEKKLAEVVILTTGVADQPANETVSGIPVHRMGSDPFTFLIASFKWLMTHASEYDVIHAHLASSHAIGGALAGRILKKKVIVKLSGSRVVGEMAVSKASLLGEIKLRALAWLKPMLILVSPAQREDLQGFGLEELATEFIPNGVDTGLFHPVRAEQKPLLRVSLGWEGRVFLFVGRFEPDKLRLDIFENFIKAWSASKSPDSVLYLVGKGKLESQYRSVIEQLGQRDSVHIWPARAKVAELYQAADVFVLPSVTEGLSNAMLEAMASGLPVLGSRVDGIKEVVQEGENAILFDPMSVEDIQNALGEFSSGDAASQMSDSARKTAERYSIEEAARKYAEVYRR